MSKQEEVTPQFDKQGAVRWYTRGHDGYFMKNFEGYDSRIPNIKDWLDEYIPKGSKILDVGCGDMFLSTVCPDYEWVGIDLDATKHPKAMKQDISSVPYKFKAGEFDVTICSEVLEHVFEPHKILRELNRITKTGGHLIVTVPNFDNFDNLMNHYRVLLFDIRKFWTLEHIRWYNKDSMGTLIQNSDYEVLEIIGNSPCFSETMTNNTRRLVSFMKYKYNLDLTQAQADQIYGRMFPFNCPGIGFLGKKK